MLRSFLVSLMFRILLREGCVSKFLAFTELCFFTTSPENHFLEGYQRLPIIKPSGSFLIFLLIDFM